ncbi:4-alpha-glucanotransferase [Leptolyngbya sp. 7M]|uniref:4-alpha-glucanotransferase n=1 Tax=Leptolyngbya sp. 7M TaxID=2812896 RepID=UPI001B8B6409|nr:4-alpha-glucanotransferase [Leptolyngbya sp. 7M]QYO66552.1 4-alpha-glucanotransferase [Leptolyngbya sp. 7M]
MRFPRGSGILLHITSLPGRFGIGDLGSSARSFADHLAAAGQTYWQVLPLGPTGYGDSPYVPLIAIMVLGAFWFSQKAPPAGLTEIRTIAILPFEDLSVEQKDTYLGVSLADALTNRFSSLKQLTVRPTRSVLKYADSREDPAGIGRELQVEAILDGRIQRVGERVRVSVQLIRVADNITIWTGNFDDQFTNFFAVQDSISQQIARSLAIQIDERERERFGRKGTENIQAYQGYLLGRYFWNKRTAKDLDRAIEHFSRSIELDGSFALAHAGLAETYAIYLFMRSIRIKNFCLKPASPPRVHLR